MARRAFLVVTMISTAMLVITVLLFIAGWVISPWDQFLSFSDDFHVGVLGRGIDARIVCFSDSDYGPYQGSIIGVVDADGSLYPPLKSEYAFGDSWGIYYRYFEWSDSILWTLTVTLWYPIVIFAIMPLVELTRRITHQRASNAV